MLGPGQLPAAHSTAGAGCDADRPWLACVDAGNTRARLYRVELHGEAHSLGLDGVREMASWLASEKMPRLPGPRPLACCVSSVRSLESTTELTDQICRAWGQELPLEVNPKSGLELRIRHPETVGADRLFAARGAVEHMGCDVIVVDVGTAMTVDAVLWADGQGSFLGGAIAPGPELLAKSLDDAARLHRVVPKPGAPALGRDTLGALQAGVVVGLEGAALRLVQGVSSEAGIPSAPVLLCGGALAFVDAALEESSRPVLRIPHLIAWGLALAWRGSRS